MTAALVKGLDSLLALEQETSGAMRSNILRRKEGRTSSRRRVYFGQGLTLSVHAEGREIRGEVVDFTGLGLGVAVTSEDELPAEGMEVELEHTGRATKGIRQYAVVRHVGEGTFGGKRLPRLGLAFTAAPRGSGSTENRRQGERHNCPVEFPAIAFASSPLFFREWLSFRVFEVGPGGATLTLASATEALMPGVELPLTITLAMLGQFEVRARVLRIRKERSSQGEESQVGVQFIDASPTFLRAIAEYLMLGNKDLTPSLLRKEGFQVGSIERAVNFEYGDCPKDYRAILDLRLRANQAEGKLKGATVADMASPYDDHSRHIVCRFGDRIIAYARMLFTEGDPAKSEFATAGHVIPDWLWEAGFVESGAIAIDPEFQKAGLFVPLLQQTALVIRQSGYRYLLGAVSDDLLPMYKTLGIEPIETRIVEPHPGMQFRSNLVFMDMYDLLTNAPEGRAGEAIASAIAFVGIPDVA